MNKIQISSCVVEHYWTAAASVKLKAYVYRVVSWIAQFQRMKLWTNNNFETAHLEFLFNSRDNV